MIAIEITKDEIGPYIEQLAVRSGDMSQPSATALRAGLAGGQQALAGGLASLGPAISPWTLTIDEALGRPRGGTGALSESLSEGAPGNIFEVTPEGGRAGTSLPAAFYQQEGTSTSFLLLQHLASNRVRRGYGGGGIPARPFLTWNQEAMPEIDQAFLNWITEGEGNA